MTKSERIRAAIAGEPVDTIPYSIWSHMPQCDREPELIAEKTYSFYKDYDIDLVKTMNNGMYSIEDFGCTVDFSEVEKGGMAKITSTPISSHEDWAKIEPLDLTAPALARELHYLELLMEKMQGEDVPVVFTVFSPITTAQKLSGGKILEHLEEGAGEEIRRALEAITETTCKLVKAAVEMGAAGVFLASQLSNYSIMSEELYATYGKPYDVRVLEASAGWCNVLHAHGDSIMFGLLKDYPVQVFNWHAWESLPKIDEAADLTGKCLMGGIERMEITRGNKGAIHHQIYRTIKTLGGRGMILAPGCVIRYPLEEEMLRYIRATKVEIERALLK